MQALKYYLLLALAAGCSAPTEQAATTPPLPVVTATIPTPPAPATIVFDIPALVGKTIDQVATALGKPSEADAPNDTEGELERRYVRQAHRLVITYDTKTRHTTGFFLATAAPGGVTKNCSPVLRAGNLSLHSSAYELDSLESEKPGYYTGIVVTELSK